MSLRPIVLAALAAVVAWPLAAQDKKTVGTLLALEAGDVACYLTLRDDAGQRFRELAEFEICDQRSLLNKRVSLTYRRASVMADECQGNPDCKKTRSVMLVASARAIAAAPAPPAPPAPASLCTTGETIVYSCAAGAKTISVCAGQGYLQYRFGRPGAIEMSLPEGRVAPARAASGEAVGFSGGGGVWLRFAKPPHAYVVYDGIGNWGRGGAKKIIAGVVVEHGGKKVANVKCTSRPQAAIGPDWFRQSGIATNNQDFDFPTDD